MPRIGTTSATSLLLCVNKSLLVPLSDKHILPAKDNAPNLHSMYVQAQRSLPVFDVKLLERLYVKGYAPLVAKILVKLA